jgi:DNA processing protein
MTHAQNRPGRPGACDDCLRRSWLLAELGPALDYRCRRQGELIELLALEDAHLLRALGGRRREELSERYARFYPELVPAAEGTSAVCRHDRSFPDALGGESAPKTLYLAGTVERFERLMTAPVVAIAGSTWATDYGVETAKSIARGLAASGVTVVSALTDGIAVAAHAGALELDAPTVAVLGGGLDVSCPARRRSLYARVRRLGSAVAEIPCGCPGRRWGQLACERILAGLAQLTVVVEAADSARELVVARLALGLGRTVAAVPGRVTSSASRGTHALLIGGAPLVRDASDVLDLLYRTRTNHRAAGTAGHGPSRLQVKPDARLNAILERVGAGRDTPEQLTGAGEDPGQVLLALSELELLGLLARGDGGRYVPREPIRR